MERSRPSGTFPPLFPFVISYDGPDNASSMAHLLDAPAGKHGFIRVEDGRFVNDAGPVRLHATNLTGPANFPTHEQADKLAARLARFGINCVRLHYFDAEYGNFMTEKETGIFGKGGSLPDAFTADPTVPIPFAPEQVDRQDYLIAALKRRGIYVDINLHVATVSEDRCSFLEPRMIASEKEYAQEAPDARESLHEAGLHRRPLRGGDRDQQRERPAHQYSEHRPLPDPYAANSAGSGTIGCARNTGRRPPCSKPGNGRHRPCATSRFPRAVRSAGRDGWQAVDPVRGFGSKPGAGAADGVMKIVVTRDGDEFFPKLFRHLSVEERPAVHAVVQDPLRGGHAGRDARPGRGRREGRLAVVGSASDHQGRSELEDGFTSRSSRPTIPTRHSFS